MKIPFQNRKAARPFSPEESWKRGKLPIGVLRSLTAGLTDLD
jgi:hypothetical protein